VGSGADGARLDGGIPPHCRNQRLPTAGDTPAIAAASSLERPIAIAFQNGHRSARCRTGGLPGDRSLGRWDRFVLDFFCVINTSVMDVLQRLVESTQYTSVDFGKRCTEMGVRPSMGSVGDAYDNAMAESFFASLECELIDRRVWKSFAQARMEIFTWIEGWYNPRRRHSGLGHKSPVNFEREQAARATRGRPACDDGLPNGCFAPVDKPPQGSMKGPSPCPQASPLDNPAPNHAHVIRDQPQ
jgi:Integrase core domain